MPDPTEQTRSSWHPGRRDEHSQRALRLPRADRNPKLPGAASTSRRLRALTMWAITAYTITARLPGATSAARRLRARSRCARAPGKRRLVKDGGVADVAVAKGAEALQQQCRSPGVLDAWAPSASQCGTRRTAAAASRRSVCSSRQKRARSGPSRARGRCRCCLTGPLRTAV